MRSRSIFAAFTLGFCATCLAEYEMRTWKSTAGSTIEAKLVKQDGENVELFTKKGQKLNVQTSQLSAEDQTYLSSLVKGESSTEASDPTWENWDAEWPKDVRTKNDFKINLGEPINDYDTHQYVYKTPNFIFYSDVSLTTTLIKKFSWYFEATHDYVSQIPISSARTQEKKLHKIILFEDKNDYHKNGGPHGSSGVFISGKSDYILVPFESVGVMKVGQRYSYDFQNENNKTLAHEIVHILTDKQYLRKKGLRGWFSEGLAEFVSVTPYRSGHYKVSRVDDAVKAYVSAYGREGKGGRNLGEEIKVGPLKSFMTMSYNDFTNNGNRNYGIGALLATYFLDLERDVEFKNLQNMLKAAKAGKEGDDLFQILLNGRTFEELEESIQKAWRSKGITLNFS